jgi:acyl carrier protein
VNTKLRLIQLFKEVFPSLSECDDDAIRVACVEKVNDWDSITSLNLLVLLEEEFNITIIDDVAPDLDSFSAILSHLEATAA